MNISYKAGVRIRINDKIIKCSCGKNRFDFGSGEKDFKIICISCNNVTDYSFNENKFEYETFSTIANKKIFVDWKEGIKKYV